jgi:hypothetical protein
MQHRWWPAILALLVSTPLVAEERPSPAGATGNYLHVVVFRLKKDAPKSALPEIIADCHTMLAKIPSVRQVKAGRPAEKATPKLARTDYDLALLVLVDDADGLTAYLEHPLHLAFVKKHGKHFDMERLRVFDFVNQRK